MDKSLLFVYGTLKKGGRLHNVLGNSSEFLGVFETVEDKFDMFDYGCPVMVPVLDNNGFKIKGELYSVTLGCMSRVTAIECGAGYVPFIVDVNGNNYPEGEPSKAIAFMYPTPYATVNVSDRVEKKNGVKVWNDVD